MKLLNVLLIAMLFALPGTLIAQKITYSEFNNEDDRDISFEILGKFNNSYVIYKSIRWKHVLAFYDEDMHITRTERLTFVPDKTFNIDFITYPDHFYMVYQYQKNSTVHCKGVTMNAEGKKLTEPVDLDTTRIGMLADNKIYNTIYSQDKQKILIYKMQRRNGQMTLMTKLFDVDFKMLDSTREVSDFDDRKDVYSELVVDNDGRYAYTRGTKRINSDNLEALNVIYRKPGALVPRSYALDLQGKFLATAKLKIDNLNKHYLINSLFSLKEHGNVSGIFTAILDANDVDTARSAFNVFPDSLRQRFNTDGQVRAAFDNLVIRQAIVKKDGGVLLTTEAASAESHLDNDLNRWNRYNYLYNSPYTYSSDYYMLNPAYETGYYRPLNSSNLVNNVRYYYDDILVLSMDNKLNIQWNSIIPKKQSDDDSDNFLSFFAMNSGAEVHFIYIQEDRNRQVISNQSIFPDGEMKRYPTLKSREAGYDFMPRLSKQVGYNVLIVPCIYRTNIAFAKVVFFD